MTEQRGRTFDVGSDGRLVRATRERSGLSLRAVAHAIGVSPATLSAVERGRTPLTVDRLHRIADAIGVPPERLLTGPGASGPEQSPLSGHGAGTEKRQWRMFAPPDLDPVLDSAAVVFVRTGYHGATMRQIAAGAGMSVPGVYHHYPSKQRILVTILDWTMADLRWRVLAARDEGGRPSEQFARMVEALALFHAVRRDLAFIGASEMRSIEEPERTRIVNLRNEVQYLLDAVVADAIRAGEFATPNPHDAARAVATMCTALAQWFRLGGPSTPEHIAREYAEFALAMMRLA